jgi:hypothetical protein
MADWRMACHRSKHILNVVIETRKGAIAPFIKGHEERIVPV